MRIHTCKYAIASGCGDWAKCPCHYYKPITSVVELVAFSMNMGVRPSVRMLWDFDYYKEALNCLT